MFTAIESSPRAISLFKVENALLAATGPYLGVARAGKLHHVKAAPLTLASRAGGAAEPETFPEQIMDLQGQWPDATWAMLRAGWRADAMPSGHMATPTPRHVGARWDPTLQRWQEDPELVWIGTWAGRALAFARDGHHRWLDGSRDPIPPILTDATFGSPWAPPSFPSTRTGNAMMNVTSSPRFRPGWWIFPGGSSDGHRFEGPPEVARARRVHLLEGHAPGTLVAHGELESGGPFLSACLGGVWERLPTPRCAANGDIYSLLFSSSGAMLACSALLMGRAFTIEKLSPGRGFELLDLRDPLRNLARLGRLIVPGTDDDLWLVYTDGSAGDRSVLYHAFL